MVQCCDFTPATFNVLINLERRVRTADGQGGWEESWVADPPQGVWARVQNTSGTERYEAMRVESLNLVNFFIRYRGDSFGAPYWRATDTRVVVRGRYYNILAIVDLEMKKRVLRLYCQEGDAH